MNSKREKNCRNAYTEKEISEIKREKRKKFQGMKKNRVSQERKSGNQIKVRGSKRKRKYIGEERNDLHTEKRKITKEIRRQIFNMNNCLGLETDFRKVCCVCFELKSSSFCKYIAQNLSAEEQERYCQFTAVSRNKESSFRICEECRKDIRIGRCHMTKKKLSEIPAMFEEHQQKIKCKGCKIPFTRLLKHLHSKKREKCLDAYMKGIPEMERRKRQLNIEEDRFAAKKFKQKKNKENDTDLPVTKEEIAEIQRKKCKKLQDNKLTKRKIFNTNNCLGLETDFRKVCCVCFELKSSSFCKYIAQNLSAEEQERYCQFTEVSRNKDSSFRICEECRKGIRIGRCHITKKKLSEIPAMFEEHQQKIKCKGCKIPFTRLLNHLHSKKGEKCLDAYMKGIPEMERRKRQLNIEEVRFAAKKFKQKKNKENDTDLPVTKEEIAEIQSKKYKKLQDNKLTKRKVKKKISQDRKREEQETIEAQKEKKTRCT